ncbi:Transcriptional regulator, AraC family [Sulfurovum sp. enrichment culture clone C5]|uniref:Transcriptional regulator, AraC family n=1 Tax=Sulfurovum sp. enrichment culture clone C5 TaxID=497650 RepID=A0A0S4XP05_9BACT|nr:Transcriptional regulator, AraC family [Sulfurovum sp. enrichment culture clone C5]
MREIFESSRKELIDFIIKKYDTYGEIVTQIPSLHLYKINEISEFIHIIYEPSVCIILQGSKAVGLGNNMYSYDPGKYLLVSTNIPANIKIEEASQELPYFSLTLTFELEQIYEVIKEIGWKDTSPKSNPDIGLYFDDMNEELISPISRLVKLLDTPQKNIDFLSPLIIKEILYVLLNGNSGEFLKQYVMEGTTTNQISKAITEIKNNFTQTINMKELAYRISMSESSFYHNFKKITMLSPLQFQKKLRLEEAKKILFNQDIEASQVAFDVGYESPSQFSREYVRMFGLPPKTHINYLKSSIFNFVNLQD